MPELPEVQTITSQLASAIRDRTIRSCRIFKASTVRLNADEFSKKARGRRILNVTRRGKHIIFALSGKLWIIAHLRMTGKFVLTDRAEKPRKHDHAVFLLDDGLKLTFNDMRGFGRMELTENLADHSGLNSLGWDPWDEELTADSFLKKVEKRKLPIKTILLDQKVIAGIGNIYASEILFEAGIRPQTKINEITKAQAEKILRAARKILALAVKKQGTSISDYTTITGKSGEFQNFLKVYGRAGKDCRACSSAILKIKQNQRSGFYCPTCQK